jgi:hypothetical protein
VTADDTYIPSAVESGGRRAHRKRRHLKVSYFVFLGLAALIVTRLDAGSLHLYSLGAMGLLALKMFGALFYRPAKAGREELEYLEDAWVTAVIPIYNEDPVMFEQGMRSLLAQSRLPNEIHIIDDCSADPGGLCCFLTLAMSPEENSVTLKDVRLTWCDHPIQSERQLTSSFDFSGRIHIHQPDVCRRALWYYNMVTDAHGRGHGRSKCLTCLVIV